MGTKSTLGTLAWAKSLVVPSKLSLLRYACLRCGFRLTGLSSLQDPNMEGSRYVQVLNAPEILLGAGL